MAQLKINLTKKEHPYPNEPSSSFELWGEFLLCYGDQLLIDTQWDITDFIKWFGETKEYLRTEKFSFDFTNSIAESRNVLFGKIDEFLDSQTKEMFDYVEYLADYFANHYFHLRGTETQAYYIGLVPNDYGELPSCINGECHSFFFDMEKWLNETYAEITCFLETVSIGQERKSFFVEALSEHATHLRVNE